MKNLHTILLLISSLTVLIFFAQTNVILIMADDAGLECFDAYGASEYNTPNLDTLFLEGAKFGHVYAQPLCTPSRVQIMTGKYNVRNYTQFGELKQGEKTFGNYFQDGGYKTAIVGKWQLGNQNQNVLDFGFDDFFLWTSGARYLSPNFNMNGTTSNYSGAYGPDLELDFIKNFITTNKDSSFFLYYTINLPHFQFLPTPVSDTWPIDNLYNSGNQAYKDSIDNLFFDTYIDPNNNLDFFSINNCALAPGATNRGDTTYFADMVFYMDSVVGEITKHLENLNLSNNTLLIFTTDNGTDDYVKTQFQNTTGSYNLQGAKATPSYLKTKKVSDLGTRTPLLARMPGTISPGIEIHDLIDFSDILPSILDAANITMNACEKATTDGFSFWPQLTGNQGISKDVHYTYFQERFDIDTIEYTQDKNYKFCDNTFYFKPAFPQEEIQLEDYELSCIELAIKDRLKRMLNYYTTLNSNCSSCTTNFADSDGDFVCDALDTCIGFDNALIGYPCDDGDSSTERDIYMPNCTCEGIPISESSCNNGCLSIASNSFIKIFNKQLQILDPFTGTQNAFGDTLDFTASGIGLNEQDGLIYAHLANGQTGFDSSGNAIQSGDIITINPLNGTINLVYAGTFNLVVFGGDVENGQFYFNARNTDDFYAYHINNSTLTNLSNNGLHDWPVGDIAVLNGIAYGLQTVDSSTLHLLRADLLAGTIITETLNLNSPFNFTGTAQEEAFGSAFIANNSRIFFTQNQGGLFELTDFTSLSPQLNFVNDAPEALGGNDGTSCRSAVQLVDYNNCIDIAENGFIQIRNDQLRILDPITGSTSDFGNPLGFTPSGIGLNFQDGLIYANLANVQSGYASSGDAIQSGDIITINPSDGTSNLVYPNNFNLQVFGGDVEDGNYYFNDRITHDFFVYAINENSLTNLSNNGQHDWFVGDIVVLNGIAYGLRVDDATTLSLLKANLKANPIATEITTLNSPVDFTGTGQEETFGSAFVSLSDRIFFTQNQGGLFELIDYECTVPELIFISNAPAALDGNDGTNCKNVAISFLDENCSKNVENGFNFGIGAFRSAIICAANNDTVYFNPILNNQSIQLENPLILIHKNLNFFATANQNITLANSILNSQNLLIKISENVHFNGLNLIGDLNSPITINMQNNATLTITNGTLENIAVYF